MSLDVYLRTTDECYSAPAIFIREDGQNKQITLAEWKERFPDREPVIIGPTVSTTVFQANITHNLKSMAAEAGLWQLLWRPDEVGVTKAEQLINPLSLGLLKLRSDPARFKEFNPLNGWGTYEGLVTFVSNYLDACKEYPDATVSACR